MVEPSNCYSARFSVYVKRLRPRGFGGEGRIVLGICVLRCFNIEDVLMF